MSTKCLPKHAVTRQNSLLPFLDETWGFTINVPSLELTDSTEFAHCPLKNTLVDQLQHCNNIFIALRTTYMYISNNILTSHNFY